MARAGLRKKLLDELSWSLTGLRLPSIVSKLGVFFSVVINLWFNCPEKGTPMGDRGLRPPSTVSSSSSVRRTEISSLLYPLSTIVPPLRTLLVSVSLSSWVQKVFEDDRYHLGIWRVRASSVVLRSSFSHPTLRLLVDLTTGDTPSLKPQTWGGSISFDPLRSLKGTFGMFSWCPILSSDTGFWLLSKILIFVLVLSRWDSFWFWFKGFQVPAVSH